MSARSGLRWGATLGGALIAAALISCGGEPGNVAAARPNPIMGELMSAQYACMRNPADPHRRACCDGNGCSRVTSQALPPAPH